MDNFHFVNVKPSIERKDVSLIKEAIFRRAREKTEQMNEEQNNQYTSEIKNDIMELASADFRSTEFNPFNQFKESLGLNETKQELVKPETEEVKSVDKEDTEPQKYELKPLKHNIESVSNNTYTNSMKEETMAAASSQFRYQNNLTMSLNFLNAQAAIQMAKYAHSKINYTA